MNKYFIITSLFLLCSCGERMSHSECVEDYINDGYSREESTRKCYEDNYDGDIRSGT